MQRYHLCPIWSRIHDQTRWCVLLGSLTSSGRSFTAAETEISATSSNKKSTSRKVRGNTSSSPIGKKYAPQKIPDSTSKIFNFQHHSDHSCWILVANFKALHFAEGIVVSRSQFDVYPSSFVPVLASHNAMHALAKLSFSAGNDFTNGTNRKPADLKEMDCCFDSTESQTAKKKDMWRCP